MTGILTLGYVLCFQCCAWPALIRMYRRRSSADLSVWREVLLLIGVGCQFAVMWRTDAAWQVLISPVVSAMNLGVVLYGIRHFRGQTRQAD